MELASAKSEEGFLSDVGHGVHETPHVRVFSKSAHVDYF